MTLKTKKWDNSLRICKQCNEQYKPKKVNQELCSGECRKKFQKQKYKSIWDNSLRICVYCNKQYKPIQPNQKYCTKKCLQQINKNNQKENFKFRMSYGNVKDYYIFERDDFKCIYCGKSSIEDNRKLHIDHIIPQSINGTHLKENLVTSCEECNILKSNKINKELIERVKKIVKKRNN